MSQPLPSGVAPPVLSGGDPGKFQEAAVKAGHVEEAALRSYVDDLFIGPQQQPTGPVNATGRNIVLGRHAHRILKPPPEI